MTDSSPFPLWSCPFSCAPSPRKAPCLPTSLPKPSSAPERETLAPGEIDLLLFAPVSADVQEPVNVHIVAVKTGLTCPVFGVSNACNSVLNALE